MTEYGIIPASLIVDTRREVLIRGINLVDIDHINTDLDVGWLAPTARTL